MSQPSPDARAVVRALDALTTQVRRLADGAATPVVRVTGDDPTTGVRAIAHHVPADAYRTWTELTPADAQRTARRHSLRVLLNRVNNGTALTADEAQLLARHVATEICDANDTAKAQAAIERVRQVTTRRLSEGECDESERHGYHSALNDVRRALDGTGQPTTED